MPLDAPFRLGPFIVDGHGRLQPGEPDLFPSFRFIWRNCPVQARLKADGQTAATVAHLSLTALLGRVPSSAGADPARNRERRAAALGALQGLGQVAVPGSRMRLLPDHRVTLEAAREVALPASAADLLTQIACFLLDLAPYLDLVAGGEVPVDAVVDASAAASGSAGTAKTWPG